MISLSSTVWGALAIAVDSDDESKARANNNNFKNAKSEDDDGDSVLSSSSAFVAPMSAWSALRSSNPPTPSKPIDSSTTSTSATTLTLTSSTTTTTTTSTASTSSHSRWTSVKQRTTTAAPRLDAATTMTTTSESDSERSLYKTVFLKPIVVHFSCSSCKQSQKAPACGTSEHCIARRYWRRTTAVVATTRFIEFSCRGSIVSAIIVVAVVIGIARPRC